MGVVVLSSNYLVQFPINYYGLSNILTYGAFSYPIAFLITDLANRSYGKIIAKKIVYFGFLLGIGFSLLFSTDFADYISIRVAIGSGTAFLTAQLLDVQIFDNLRKKKWFIAPLTSSVLGSITDTFLFFSISFYSTGVPWVTLAIGDFMVKLILSASGEKFLYKCSNIGYYIFFQVIRSVPQCYDLKRKSLSLSMDQQHQIELLDLQVH